MNVRLLELKPIGVAAGEPGPVLRAGIERTAARLSLRYVLGGPLAHLRIPAPASSPRRTDHLWEHTCFEAFLAPAGAAAYWEINISPTGDWNLYRFDGYRGGMRPESRTQAPACVMERASCGTITMRATIDLTPIAALGTTALEVGLAAVLESNDGVRSYWALRHAGAAPDFHQRATFVVPLPAEDRP